MYKIDFKVFRVYAKYKKQTEKGGSGYDLLQARFDIFDELNAWISTTEPKSILYVNWELFTMTNFNAKPFIELNIIYEAAKEETWENFENVIRRLKELWDWSLLNEDNIPAFIGIFEQFLRKGKSMSWLRTRLIKLARKYYKQKIAENEEKIGKND